MPDPLAPTVGTGVLHLFCKVGPLADAGDIAVVVGGTIPQGDVPKLLDAGAAAVFPTGTPLDVLVDEVRKLTSERVD